MRRSTRSLPPESESYKERQTQGRVNFKDSSAGHQRLSSVATVIAQAFDSQNPLAEQLDLEFSTNTDAIDPTVTINELFQHTSKNPSDYPNITQMRNLSGTAKDTANSGFGEGATASIGSEGVAANANTTTPFFSPPGTYLRSWGGCLQSRLFSRS